jgi:hypothetical protein
MATMAQRQGAAVHSLVNDGVITAGQADAVLAALHQAATPPGRQRGWWFEILGYVGGGLMLAGAATLVGLSWEDLTRGGKVTLLGVVFLALLGAAIAIGGGPTAVHRLETGTKPIRRRVVGVLLALSTVPAALAAGVAVDGNPAVLPQLAGLLVAAGGYVWLRTVPGLLAAAVFGVSTAGTALDGLDGDAFALSLAGVFVALGAAWIALSMGGLVIPRDLGLTAGAGIAVIGAQQPLTGTDSIDWWAYAGTFAIALACLALYRHERSLVLLAAGVISITLAVPEAVWDITNGAGGAAAILLISGAALLGASGAGLWMHRTRPDSDAGAIPGADVERRSHGIDHIGHRT